MSGVTSSGQTKRGFVTAKSCTVENTKLKSLLHYARRFFV
jgi:hypothetical protein